MARKETRKSEQIPSVILTMFAGRADIPVLLWPGDAVSTSAYSALVVWDSMHYFKRQILFCIVGFIGMYIVMKIDYHVYIKWAKPIYFFSVFMMLLVKTPLGKK